MKLFWIRHGFICKDLFGPFIIGNDSDYKADLNKRLNIMLRQAKLAGADAESISIMDYFKEKILDALNSYYRADISRCNTIILNLIKKIGDNELASSTLDSCRAFHGRNIAETQFFRSRVGNPSCAFSKEDMLHLPQSLRVRADNYRFSIPGNPSYYLSNSSYGCWIETGYPAEIDFNVSPVLLDGTQKIFNMAVYIRDFGDLNDFESDRVHTWIKLLMLSIATSYRVKEKGRSFKSEYIISQAIMMACKKLGYDGIAYYSRRVSDYIFAKCAINLVLFVDYSQGKEYSQNLIKHIKLDDAYNYAVFKNLAGTISNKEYELKSTHNEYIINISFDNYDRQYPYSETEFYRFDQFLFASWSNKSNGKGKDEIGWGMDIEVSKECRKDSGDNRKRRIESP